MVPAPSKPEVSLSAALRNGELAIRQRFKKTDPSHKNCFGNQHFSLPTSFGKIFGWTIIGDLHAIAYNLEQTLQKLLATEGRPCWQDCRPSSKLCPLFEPVYSLQSFLVGPDKEHASPHLTIITSEQWVAKTLKTCIMQSQILECFPRWGCLGLPAHVALKSGDPLDAEDSGDARNDNGTFKICVFEDDIPIHLDGVLVEVWKDETSVGKVTIGGFLTIGERILALSTAHSFSPPQQTTLNSFQFDESDLEFLTDDLSSDDQSELDGTYSSPDTSEYCCLQSCRASSPSTVDTGLVPSSPPQRKITIGHLEYISKGYDATGPSFEGLDWALIAITHPKIIVGNKLRHPQTGQGATDDNSSVEIVTSSRSIKANIVSSAIFGTTRNLSRSVLVADSSDINLGDSGSWCFSQRGSEALGMVLGNCQTVNQCYLEIMGDIKADIEAQIGVHVEVAPMEPLSRLVQPNFLRFVDDQKCYGIDGNYNEEYFITAARLKEFWSPKLVSSLLNDLGLEGTLDSDCVLENYVRIWSILVYINAHKEFKWFVEQGINDTQLPIRREHERITEGSRTFIEPFEANQGIFCLNPETARMSSNTSNDPIVQPARPQDQPKSGSSTVFDLLGDIEAICSNEYSFSPLSIIRRLRDGFPEYFVNKVDNYTIDLPAFAGPGRAQSTLEEHRNHVNGIRYAGEASSITYTGSQEAEILVSKFKYSWNGTDFILFVLCFDTLDGDRAAHHFLLTPCDTPANEGGLHPKARELCLAAGQYTSQHHKRALLLTNGSHDHFAEVDYKVWESFQSHRLTDMMMDTATKEKLTKDTQSFFASRELFRNFNLAWKRSVLFHGPAGTGKTASIKAVIAMLAEGEHLVPCIYVKFAEKRDMYTHNITMMFSKARQIAPCLLAIEDLDLCMEENVRGTFLAELDSELNDGILIIGSTQNLPKLHPALRARPGRFDLKYEFKLPGYDERLAFAKQWKSKLDENHLVDLPEEACELVANLTEGFNFTYLTDLFSSLLFYSQDTPTEGIEEQSEASEARKNLQNAEQYGEISSSLRQQAFAEVAMPPSLTKSHVAKFLRQQASVLLEEIENDSNASPGYNAYRHEVHKTANSIKDSPLRFDPYTSDWGIAPMVDSFPSYERKAKDAGNAALFTTAASRDG